MKPTLQNLVKRHNNDIFGVLSNKRPRLFLSMLFDRRERWSSDHETGQAVRLEIPLAQVTPERQWLLREVIALIQDLRKSATQVVRCWIHTRAIVLAIHVDPFLPIHMFGDRPIRAIRSDRFIELLARLRFG